MSKDDLPAAATINEKSKSTLLTDSTGRTLLIRPLNILETTRVLRAAGADSTNEGWMQFAQLAAAIREIDEVPMPFPASFAHIERAIGKMGDEGFEAIIEHGKKVAAEAEAGDVWNDAKN